MKRLVKHLIVLSFDALGSNDFNVIKQYPNFKRFLEGSSYSNRVASVSPSLTYPAHCSIITSTLPKTHGVIANTLFQPNMESPDWYWHRKWVKVPTLYDKAIENGLKVASLLWPVTAKSKIQYNFPEIFANRKWQNQIIVSLLNGSPIYQYNLNKKYGHLRNGIEEPELDDFVEASLLDTIKNNKPNLVLCHFIDLDSMRHLHGYDSAQADQALIRLDKRLGNVLDLLEAEDMIDDTVLVVLGDHDQKATHSAISLRRLFADNGLINYKDGNIVSYDVMTKTSDGSTYIYVDNKEHLNEVLDLLSNFSNESKTINRILNNEEIISIGADPNADFLVEANKGYYFTDKLEDKLITQVENDSDRVKAGYMLSSHGYFADDDNYKTVFVIKGRGIKKDFNIGKMSLIDEGVTFAKVLGLSMEEAEGRLLEEIFEEDED